MFVNSPGGDLRTGSGGGGAAGESDPKSLVNSPIGAARFGSPGGAEGGMDAGGGVDAEAGGGSLGFSGLPAFERRPPGGGAGQVSKI
jgi:hypothetical protein